MKKRQAFTLVELLVVISIIALLMAVLVPGLGMARELARRIVCGNSLKGIGQANMSYASEWNGHFVPIGYPRTNDSGDLEVIHWTRNLDFRKYMQIDAYDDGEGVRGSDYSMSLYTLPKKQQCPSDLNVRDATRALGSVLISYAANFEGWGRGDWGATWRLGPIGYKQDQVKNPAEKLMYTEGVGDWWCNWNGADYTRFWDIGKQVYTNHRYRIELGGYGAVAYRHSEGVNALFFDAHVDYMRKQSVFVIPTEPGVSPTVTPLWTPVR